VEERMFCHMEKNPGTSTSTADTKRFSQNTVVQILHEQLLDPYHLQWVQGFTCADYPGRATFRSWFLQKCAINPHFLSDISFNDEAQFT
jgi:hypothetical protein